MFKVGDKVSVHVDGLPGYVRFNNCYLDAVVDRVISKGIYYKVTMCGFAEDEDVTEIVIKERVYERFDFPRKKIKFRKGESVVVDYPHLLGWWEARVIHDAPNYTTVEWEGTYDGEDDRITIPHDWVVRNAKKRKRV